MGAYNGCRLSTKALGHYFLNGLNGFPQNIHISFCRHNFYYILNVVKIFLLDYYHIAAKLLQSDNQQHFETMVN